MAKYRLEREREGGESKTNEKKIHTEKFQSCKHGNAPILYKTDWEQHFFQMLPKKSKTRNYY